MKRSVYVGHGLKGDARVNPNLKAGFSILIDVISGATTSNVTSAKEDVIPTGMLVNKNGVASTIAGLNTWAEDHTMRMRDANVWIEHTQLGRLTVGRLTNPGPQGIVDLGGVSVASASAISLLGGGFAFRRSDTGAATKSTIALATDNTGDFSRRTDAIRWDSPTLGGFVLSAAAGEAANVDRFVPTLDQTSQNGPLGLYWSAALRYAGEFSGFRVAAAVGYETSEGEENLSSSSGLGVMTGRSSNLGYSASVLHVPSGLFAQGHYMIVERPNVAGSLRASDEGTLWHVQAGIAKNWFGLGNTALYGEYARGNDLNRTYSLVTADVVTEIATKSGLDAVTSGSVTAAVNGSNEYTMWGLGVVQNIDAAAMEVYLAYRRHSQDRGFDAKDASFAVDDIHTVIGGMRIGF